VRKADNLPPSCAVVTKSGNLNFLEPSGPLQACNGTAVPFLPELYQYLISLCLDPIHVLRTRRVYLLYPLMPPKLSQRRFPTHLVSDIPDFLLLPFLIGTLVVHFRHCSYDLGRPEYRSHYSISLRAGRSGDRIPIRARFSAPVQYGYEGQLSSRKTVCPGSEAAEVCC